MGRKRTTEEFIDLAKNIHGDSFDYSKVNYVTSQTPILLTCINKHERYQRPNDHLRYGCKSCAMDVLHKNLRKTSDEFLIQANETHKYKFSYDLKDYICGNSFVTIKCPLGHESRLRASSHLEGNGCSKCTKNGYRKDKTGSIYILVFEDILKIGITNREVSKRISGINNSSGKNFKLKFVCTLSNGFIAADVETKILQVLRKQYKQLTEVFDGSTECFLDTDTEYIIKIVVNQIQDTLMGVNNVST